MYASSLISGFFQWVSNSQCDHTRCFGQCNVKMILMQASSKRHGYMSEAAALLMPIALCVQLNRTSGAHARSVMLQCLLHDAMLNTELNKMSPGKPHPGPAVAPRLSLGMLDVSTFINPRVFLKGELSF